MDGTSTSSGGRVGWLTFRGLFVYIPPVIVVISLWTGQWPTAVLLSLFWAVAFLLPTENKPLHLHLVLGSLLTYQTSLLRVSMEETNVGLVWFMAVPAMAGMLGSRIHILLWTPLTLGCITYAASFPAQASWMAHPLSLPNLWGSTLVIAGAAFGVAHERVGQTAVLEGALQEAQQAVDDQRRATEEARDAQEKLNQFLAMMSHELRTPMTTILLSAELLEESLVDENHLQAARDAHSSATNLLETFNDVLDLSAIRAGDVDQKEVRCDLGALLEGLRALMEPLARDAGLLLVVETQLQGVWTCDRARLRQVLINLTSNGIKNTRRGKVRVSVERAASGLRFIVEDTGIGIEASQQTSIFEPYVQLESSLGTEGTGLGLAIAQGFVKTMGGEIAVESGPHGSRFTFELPCQPIEAPAVVLESSPSAPVSDRRSQLCGVCDDNAEIRRAISLMMQAHGYSVVAFASGRELLASSAAIDVLFLDAQMPGLSGIETLRELRREQNQVPVCILSGGLMDGKEVLAAGANAYLRKPVLGAALAEMAEQLIHAQATITAAREAT